MKKSVLVIDSYDCERKVYSSLLPLRESYQFFSVKDELEAKELYPKILPEIVIVDADTPKKGGFYSINFIREYEQEHCLPSSTIIVTTSSYIDQDYNGPGSFGVDYFLEKPFTAPELELVATKTHEQGDAGINRSGNSSTVNIFKKVEQAIFGTSQLLFRKA